MTRLLRVELTRTASGWDVLREHDGGEAGGGDRVQADTLSGAFAAVLSAYDEQGDARPPPPADCTHPVSFTREAAPGHFIQHCLLCGDHLEMDDGP